MYNTTGIIVQGHVYMYSFVNAHHSKLNHNPLRISTELMSKCQMEEREKPIDQNGFHCIKAAAPNVT